MCREAQQIMSAPQLIREAPASHSGAQWVIAPFGPHRAESAGPYIGRLRLPLGVPSETKRAAQTTRAGKTFPKINIARDMSTMMREIVKNMKHEQLIVVTVWIRHQLHILKQLVNWQRCQTLQLALDQLPLRNRQLLGENVRNHAHRSGKF